MEEDAHRYRALPSLAYTLVAVIYLRGEIAMSYYAAQQRRAAPAMERNATHSFSNT